MQANDPTAGLSDGTAELAVIRRPLADARFDSAEIGLESRSVDEWLTLIAAGQAVGITPEATAHQYPRPGVAYRVLRQATPISVRMVWWRDDPPPWLPELLELTRSSWTGVRSG